MRDVYAFMAIVLAAMALKGFFVVKRTRSSGAVLVMPEDRGRHGEIRRGAMRAARDVRDLPAPQFTTSKLLGSKPHDTVVVFEGGDRPESATTVYNASKRVATDDYSAGYLAAISSVVASLPEISK